MGKIGIEVDIIEEVLYVPRFLVDPRYEAQERFVLLCRVFYVNQLVILVYRILSIVLRSFIVTIPTKGQQMTLMRRRPHELVLRRRELLDRCEIRKGVLLRILIQEGIRG